jgi:L-asparaginase/Glu-tRNA(Gln) amidotransferase subunit D
MIDSRAVDLKFLHDLAKLTQDYINDELVDGIIIIHGTDTMEITAYFLHSKCRQKFLNKLILKFLKLKDA